MKLSRSLLAAFAAVGLVAAAASADPIRFEPGSTVTPLDECAPFADVFVGRFAHRDRSADVAVGTIRGTMALDGILFSEITGDLDVSLALFGFDVDMNPLIVLGPPVTIAQDRGKWVARARSATTENQIDATSVVLRPSHTDMTASLTVKWQAQLPAGMAWGVDFIPYGVFVQGLLHDGTTVCVTTDLPFMAIGEY